VVLCQNFLIAIEMYMMRSKRDKMMMREEAIRERGAICFAGTTAILISILAINAATLAAAEVTISSTYYCNDGKVIQSASLEDMNYEWNAIIHQEELGGGSMGVPSGCNMGHAKESLQLVTSEGSASTSIDIKGWRKENTNEDMGYGTGFAAGTSNMLITKWGLQNSGQSTVQCGSGVAAVDMLIQLNRMAYTGQAEADPSRWSVHANGQKTNTREDVDIGIVHRATIMGGDNFGMIDSTASCTTKNPEIPTQATFLLNSDATSRPGKKTEVSVEVPVVAGDRISKVNMIGASNWMEPQKRELEVNYFNIKSLDSMDGMGTAIETGVSFVPKMTFRI
jgi:hypothetical protein